MEFKFRARERSYPIFHSSSSSSSCPPLFPTSGYTPSPPLPAVSSFQEAAALEEGEALRRQHKKDIIRQEILMREEAEWRILEAEVLQEMQLELSVVIPPPPPPPPPMLNPARLKQLAVAEKRTAINKKKKNKKKKKKTEGSSRQGTTTAAGKWSCSVCRTAMSCEEDLDWHLRGKRHNATLKKMG